MKTRNNDMGKDEVTIISSGVIIDGKLSSNGNVRVDGVVKGDVKADGNVTVGENGEINGEITAEVVTVGGKVTGTVIGKEKIMLEAKANLKGDIITKILVVDAGAKFDGNSNMSSGSSTSTKFSEPVNPAQK